MIASSDTAAFRHSLPKSRRQGKRQRAQGGARNSFETAERSLSTGKYLAKEVGSASGQGKAFPAAWSRVLSGPKATP